MVFFKKYVTILVLFACIPAHGVRVIDVSQAPMSVTVSYKRGNSVIRQIKNIYAAKPNGTYFVQNKTFDIKDPRLNILAFPWPKQKCVEFSDAELAGLGVGVGVGAVAAGAALGTLAGPVTVGATAIPGGAAVGGTAVSGGLIGAGVGAAAGSIATGTATGILSERSCKAEHYPRTVLFSFDKKDLEKKKHGKEEFTLFPKFTDAQGQALPEREIGSYLYKTGTGFYLGDNIDGGETHFLFYNPYGFDPRKAAYGQREKYTVIQAGKINSVEYDGGKNPRIPGVLRQYLRFANHYYFGT